MTFREILERLVHDTPGARAAGILASDGIPVDEYARAGEDCDLASVGIEHQSAVDQLRKASAATGSGELREMVLTTDAGHLYLRWIDDDLYLLASLEPTAVLGKLRYLAACLQSDLRAAL